MKNIVMALLLAAGVVVSLPHAAPTGEEPARSVESQGNGKERAKGDVDAVTSASPDAVTGASPDATTGATKTAEKADLDGKIGDDDPFGLGE